MEKNMAPKWMEGHYVLDIEGNKVRITDGETLYSYEARCHPDDRFAIEDAITKIFVEMMQIREPIRVNDVVRVVDTGKAYTTYPEWVNKFAEGPTKCMYAYSSLEKIRTSSEYRVLAIGKHLRRPETNLVYIQELDGSNYGRCYIVEDKGLKKVVE